MSIACLYFDASITHIFVDDFSSLEYPDTDASEESQAHVLLREVPFFVSFEDLLPRHQIQQKQHGSTGQMVLQF